MKTCSFLLAAMACLTTSVAAQYIVAPQGMENSYTGNTTLNWRSTAFRFQMLYDQTHFTGQGIAHPISINRLRYRPINGAVSPGGQVYSNVVIQMSTSPSDHATMNTTFANNTGLDVVQVFNGNITLNPANGGTPNDDYIDITLTTPFIYNPGSGLDLCIDVTSPLPPSAAVPNNAAASDYVLHKARRCSSATPTAATGALSAFAAVVKMDYTIPPGTAIANNYGAGCNNDFVSFYEVSSPGTFDLGGSATTPASIWLLPNGQGGHTVFPGASAWFTPVNPDLQLGDDAISAPQPLSFTFPYPGGSTQSIIVESNGNVWLQPPAHTSFIVSSGPAALLTRGPVISAAYHDMDPSVATGLGSIHFDEDVANGIAYVTWVGVPDWHATPPSPRPTNTFQVVLYSTGQVELRYQAMDTSVSWAATTVGFSPGVNNRDPGNRDISATMPFSTATDLVPLTLSTSARPVIGTTISLQTGSIPPGALLTATVMGLVKYAGGISLTSFGMPGCFQYTSIDAQLGFGASNPTWSIPFTIPNNAAFVGVNLKAQSASAFPGVNAAGALASNGVELTIGSL